VAGANVFLFSDPHNRQNGIGVNDECYRTMQLAYTLKSCGVRKVNLVMPYLAYSRAERASYIQRESAQAQLFLDLMKTAGVDCILSYHLHNDAIKSFFQPKRMIGISGLNLFKDIFRGLIIDSDETIAVSTDAGGAKSNHFLAQDLGISESICNKVRSTEAEQTESLGVIGRFQGKKLALFSDDESVSFGSFMNAIIAVAPRVDEMYAAVSHNKLVEKYMYRLDEASKLGLKKLFVTDSIPQSKKLLEHPLIEVKSLDNLLVHIVNRLHYSVSVGSLFKK
jgi:ribose-phosphate pyrophosphokinase